MGCARGRVSPDEVTKLRLFADSGGYCQRPECLEGLFVSAEERTIHIGEMAHIVAASDDGPRSNPSLPPGQRGAYPNLILLCPTCHTIIDKAPEAYPDAMVLQWKQDHKSRIAVVFGAREYAKPIEVRSAIEPILAENKAIFDQYGPRGDYRSNPESEMADAWRRKVLVRILPNNRRLLAILDANRRYLTSEELGTLEAFRQHVDDMELRHLGDGVRMVGATFPGGMTTILLGDRDV